MDGPREVDLIPRPGVKTITSTKYTAVADARKAPARQPVAVCEGLRHFKCVLKTNCAPLRDGAGDSSVQKHVDEKLSKGWACTQHDIFYFLKQYHNIGKVLNPPRNADFPAVIQFSWRSVSWPCYSVSTTSTLVPPYRVRCLAWAGGCWLCCQRAME